MYYGNSSSSSARAKARALAAPEREEKWRRGLVYLLPLALLLLTIFVTGSYYENADDITITLLLQGVLTAQPTANVHLGMHGVGHVLAALYRLSPEVPWYGFFLYSALYLAMVLHFALIQRLGRRILTNPQIAVVLIGLFLMIWAEQGLWFNYTRIATLLGAGAFLGYAFDAKEPGSRHIRAAVFYTLTFLLALCIYPMGAILGAALALPAAVRVPGRTGMDFQNLVTSVVPLVLISILAFSATVLSRSDDEVSFNRLMSRYKDYHQNGTYFFRPSGAQPDAKRSYAVKEAVRDGFLGDRVAINEPYFDRAGRVDWGKFAAQRLPGKIGELAKRVALDYYLALLVNLALVIYCYQRLQSRTRRRLLVFTQVWVVVILVLIGGLWKLPPRLAGPGLAIITILNLAFLLRHRRFRLPKVPVWGWAILVVLFASHIYRTGARMLLLAVKQDQHEQFLLSLERRFHGQLIVGAGLETYFPALSPWETYSFGTNKLLLLTGWQTLAPEFREYLHKITGHTTLGPAFTALANRPKTIWITTIGFEQRINHLLAAVHRTHLTLVPFKPHVQGPLYDNLNEYLVAIRPGGTAPAGAFPGQLLKPLPTMLPDSARLPGSAPSRAQ